MTPDPARQAAEKWMKAKMFAAFHGNAGSGEPAQMSFTDAADVAARIAADFAFSFGLATRHEDIEWIWAEARDCGCSDRIMAHIKEQFPWAEAMKESDASTNR